MESAAAAATGSTGWAAEGRTVIITTATPASPQAPGSALVTALTAEADKKAYLDTHESHKDDIGKAAFAVRVA